MRTQLLLLPPRPFLRVARSRSHLLCDPLSFLFRRRKVIDSAALTRKLSQVISFLPPSKSGKRGKERKEWDNSEFRTGPNFRMERERGTETKMWRRGIDINGSETHYFIRKTPFFSLLCHGLFCFLSWTSCSKISLILVLVYGTAHEKGTYKTELPKKGQVPFSRLWSSFYS